jgi:hypothetical protein
MDLVQVKGKQMIKRLEKLVLKIRRYCEIPNTHGNLCFKPTTQLAELTDCDGHVHVSAVCDDCARYMCEELKKRKGETNGSNRTTTGTATRTGTAHAPA